VFTLRVYAQASMRRDKMAKAQADAFDRAPGWAQLGMQLRQISEGLGSTAQTIEGSFDPEATKRPV
jgi:hypothetical protein